MAKENEAEETSVDVKAELSEKEEQKKPTGSEEPVPEQEETPSKKEDEEEKDKLSSEESKSVETPPDQGGEDKVAEPSHDQTKSKSGEEGDKTASESEDIEQKPTEQAADTKQSETSETTGRPSASSALERRLTSYGNSRAASVSQQRRLSGMSSARPTDPTGPGHMWDHVMLNCPQFVQLIELFLGADPEDAIVDAVSSFLRNNYTETAQVNQTLQQKYCNYFLYCRNAQRDWSWPNYRPFSTAVAAASIHCLRCGIMTTLATLSWKKCNLSCQTGEDSTPNKLRSMVQHNTLTYMGVVTLL